LKALSAVMERYPNVCVRFLGTGCSPDQVLSEFAPELRHRIEVLPRYGRDELPKLLADCEIKLLPSIAEGFGMALVEAMACGLAPVSTTTPGPMSIVESEVDGLLVPPKDSNALAEALSRLISDEDFRFRIRESAYRKAQAYSWEAVARQRLQIYREFLGPRRAARDKRVLEGA
jgi:glycosyltransferase involved in cell wall biosynthesis